MKHSVLIFRSPPIPVATSGRGQMSAESLPLAMIAARFGQEPQG